MTGLAARLSLLRRPSNDVEPATAAETPRGGTFSQRLRSRAPQLRGPGFERRLWELPLATGWAAASPWPAHLAEHGVPSRRAVHQALARLHPGADRSAESSAVFLDLETTGLGSAGSTLAFIVGVAFHVAPDRMHLMQWTLCTPVAERAMLQDVVRTLQGAVESHATLVTFNGSSFDRPLLVGRMRRLGIDVPGLLVDAPHLDLLHVARRLAGPDLPDRRLPTLERTWLGIHRMGDLDGTQVATVFGQVVAHPDESWVQERLDRARAHNRLDVVTLSLLAELAARRLSRPTDAAASVRAARYLDRCGHPGQAVACLQPFVEEALASGAATPGHRAAVQETAELLRRAGRHDEAARLWGWVCASFPGDPAAHEALAKHLEHRRREPAEALAVAQASLAPCARRVARLRRKIEAQRGSTAPPV